MRFPEGELIPNSPQEQEPRPKVWVRFHGWRHDPLNLQSIDHIRTDLLGLLEKSSGRKTVFLESGDDTHSSAEKFYKRIKIYGGLVNAHIADILQLEYNKNYTMDEILSRRDRISSGNLDRIIENELIPFGYKIVDYYLYEVLDDFRQKWGFEVKLEEHSGSFFDETRRRDQEQERLRMLSRQKWEEGHFDDMLESRKKYLEMVMQMVKIREVDVINTLKKNIKNLLGEEAGGADFILFGASHLPMISNLQKGRGPKMPVKFEANSFGVENSLEYKIALSWQNKESIADSLYAQDSFTKAMESCLLLVFIKNKNIDTYAKNFETIRDTVDKIASSLSLEEIRYICERRIDILQFMLSHPLANSIKQYLSQFY